MDLVRRRDNRPTTSFGGFDRLRDEINRLFDFDQFGNEPSLFDRELAPRVNVEERDDEVHVTCELPGVKKDDVDISVAGNLLTIRGEKKGEDEKKERNYYRRETWEGSFHRSVALPESVDPDNVKANMKDGILTVRFPKREEVKPRKIDVKVD